MIPLTYWQRRIAIYVYHTRSNYSNVQLLKRQILIIYSFLIRRTRGFTLLFSHSNYPNDFDNHQRVSGYKMARREMCRLSEWNTSARHSRRRQVHLHLSRLWLPCVQKSVGTMSGGRGSLRSVASGRQTKQRTPGSSWLRAPSLSQLAASGVPNLRGHLTNRSNKPERATW